MDEWRRHLPAGSRFVVEDLERERTLVHAWTARWRDAPDRPVLHDAATGWLDAAGLERRTRALAAWFQDAGIAKGDRVLLSGRNGVAIVVVHVALLRAGAVVVPVNGAYREREVQHIVRDCRPVAAFVDDAEWQEWIAAVDPACLVRLIDEVAATSPPAGTNPIDVTQPGDPAMIGYTSGTTGAPKGAVLSHRNLLASVAALAVAWRWTATDRLALCLPLFHMHGLGVGLHGTLYAGASAVLLDGFDPDALIDAIGQHEATLLFGVPTMYHRLATHGRADELARLRLCVSGSAPLPAALHERLHERTGQVVLERYGMTETVMLVSNPYDGERRPGSVGLPLPGVEVALLRGGSNVDLATAAADGAPGEIVVRGPNVFAGYWERSEANAGAFVDGWFRTGDLATVAPDHYLTIVGRAKELIISGGYNVYPREVEDVLETHPSVAEAAVVGLPSEEWGEEVAAFVVARGHAAVDRDGLRDFCRSRLAPYKLPRRVVVLDSLPRNALGKVIKHELRDGPPRG